MYVNLLFCVQTFCCCCCCCCCCLSLYHLPPVTRGVLKTAAHKQGQYCRGLSVSGPQLLIRNFEPFPRYLAMAFEVSCSSYNTYCQKFYFECTYYVYCTPLGSKHGCFCATSVHLPYVTIPLFDTTGMREAAGGRQPAAAKPTCVYIYMYICIS